jgi:very-short-patch-repair endonuclease
MHLGTPVIAGLLIALCVLAAAATKAKTRSSGTIATRARSVMTKNEQPMYWRLREAFPEHVVLAQVAFSALITSAKADRNRYDRKVADFVLCNQAMQVIAVVELDDSSHAGRESQDAARDALLKSAGYRVVRFQRTPDIETLRTALAAQNEQASKPTNTNAPQRIPRPPGT